MGAPSLESCERDLIAQVRRDHGDAGAHAALVRWFRRTGRPIELEPELFQALARRWLAGETTPGLTDLLLADQALETWTAADVLRVGGAVSAGVRSEDLAQEDQPAYRVTEGAQERLMEWCRGQGPTSREWWVAVLGVDPGKLRAGELPDPESPSPS